MNLKKIFTMTAIGSMVVAGLMLIAALFGIFDLEGTYVSVLLSVVTIGVSAIFSINATLIKDKGYKIVSYVAYGLIAVSAVLFLLLIWVGGDAIFRAAIVIGVSSIFANIIMGNVVSLGKKYLVVQLVEYAMVVLIDLVIILLAFGVEVFENDAVVKLFITGCIVAGVGMITLSVLSKKAESGDKVAVSNDSNSVTISKAEYNTLKEKAKLYDEMMANKNRNQNQENESANDFDNEENGAGDE